MKKSDVGMLIAVCAMLYTAGIMRRPVFLYELNLAPLNDFVLHFFGNSVFVLRMISVFAVFICTFCIWLICRMNKAEKSALIAPLFFLTNFFIFFNGISGGSAALGGCLWVAVITCGFAVLTVTVLWKKIVAGAAAAALLFTAVHFRLTAPGQNLQLWWTMLLPWGIFLPVLVRNVWGRRQEILQNKLSLFGIFLTVFPLITAVVLRRSDALCGAIAASSVLLAQLVNLTEKKTFDRTLTYFSAVVLPFPVLFFLWQTAGRFTDWIPAKYLLYMKGENYFVPVIALTLLAVWWKMAVKEENGNKKFLYVCAGLAFVMLAVPHALPVKYLRQEAVEIFITSTLERIKPGKDTVLLASGKEMTQAVRWSLSRKDVDDYRPQKVPKGRETLIFTADQAEVKALPHPKSYYTNGKYYIVHNPGRSLK